MQVPSLKDHSAATRYGRRFGRAWSGCYWYLTDLEKLDRQKTKLGESDESHA